MSVSGRQPTAGKNTRVSETRANEALELMERALNLIDAQEGAQDAGAHLDLAIHRLREWIALRAPK